MVHFLSMDNMLLSSCRLLENQYFCPCLLLGETIQLLSTSHNQDNPPLSNSYQCFTPAPRCIIQQMISTAIYQQLSRLKQLKEEPPSIRILQVCFGAQNLLPLTVRMFSLVTYLNLLLISREVCRLCSPTSHFD